MGKLARFESATTGLVVAGGLLMSPAATRKQQPLMTTQFQLLAKSLGQNPWRLQILQKSKLLPMTYCLLMERLVFWDGSVNDYDYNKFVAQVCDKEGVTDCIINSVSGVHVSPVDTEEKDTVQAVELSFELSFTEGEIACSATMKYLQELQVDKDMPIFFGLELTPIGVNQSNC